MVRSCQLAFGLVGGYVIARSTSISTMQSWPIAERAFLHAPGVSGTARGREVMSLPAGKKFSGQSCSAGLVALTVAALRGHR